MSAFLGFSTCEEEKRNKENWVQKKGKEKRRGRSRETEVAESKLLVDGLRLGYSAFGIQLNATA